jgi:solute carrier family 50 protein (sugar transporter)
MYALLYLTNNYLLKILPSMSALPIIALAANISAILFYISPIHIIMNLIKTKETKTVPYLLFLFTILNCELWVIYGFQDYSWEIYFNNSIGMVMNTIYITIFIFYLGDIRKKLVFLISIYGMIAIVFVYLMQVIAVKKITGLLAMILNIFMFLSPLQKSYEVFKYKTNIYIPLYLVISMLICTSLWIAVGILKNNDIFIIVPNSIGLGISLLQTLLFYIFRDTSVKLEKDLENVRSEKEEYSPSGLNQRGSDDE